MSMYRGDDKTINLTFTQDGSALDISGSTVTLTLKNSTRDSDVDAVLQKTVTSHSDPTNGITAVSITHDESDGLVPADYTYDIQIQLADDSVSTVVKGTFSVLADVTRTVV